MNWRIKPIYYHLHCDFVKFFGFFHGLDPSNHKTYLFSNAKIFTFTYLHKTYYIPGGKKLAQILVALEPSLAVDTFAAAVASSSSNSTQYSISIFLIKFVNLHWPKRWESCTTCENFDRGKF